MNTIVETIEAFFDFKGILLTAVIFVPLERAFPMYREQGTFRRQWKTDLVYLLLNGALIRACMAVFVAAMILLFDRSWIDAMQQVVRRQPEWLQAVELILLADLGFYWAHRTLHRYPMLWRFHSIHHSIETLDWLAGYRVHVLDQTLVKATSILPFLFFGFSEWAFVVHVVTYRWQSVLLHSNIEISFGPLNWIVASPVFHHWHHANQREAYDKNFAGQLSLWDYVFGTAYCPKGQRPTAYGIPEPVPTGFVGQLLHPFRAAPAAEVPASNPAPREG